MTSIINNATSWVVGQVAEYPKKIALKGVACLTDAMIDKWFPNQKDGEACKLLKQLAPDILLILGDSLYQAATKPSTPKADAEKAEKAVEDLTGKVESSVSRKALKEILKLVHYSL